VARVPSRLESSRLFSYAMRPLRQYEEGVSCPRRSATLTKWRAFEVSSKRRKSYPSETHVKRGVPVVHVEVELIDKLGRNDLCPCGLGRRFQALLLEERPV
jgi:SEC-C motif